MQEACPTFLFQLSCPRRQERLSHSILWLPLWDWSRFDLEDDYDAEMAISYVEEPSGT